MYKLISKFKPFIQNTEIISRSLQLNRATLSHPMRSMSSLQIEDDDAVLLPNIEEITKGDAELEHKLKVIALEAEVMRQEGRNIPSNSFMKTHYWEELLKLDSRSGRKRYLTFLFKTEMTKLNEIARRELKKTKRENSVIEPNIQGEMRYDLGHNNIMLRIYDTTINQLYNNRLIQAMQFSQKLVIDCGYDRDMNLRECRNCAKQFMLLFSENRFHDEPFDIHYCNANKESVLIKAFHRQIPTLYEPWFPLNLHEKSYLDLFPNENLVYLTPHCREELTEYNHDAVYIIGGIVDKVNNEPLSLAKAKREGIRMAKLPLDRYLQWGSGSGKSLTLNHVTSIMLDMRRSGNWEYALRHVPKRKLVGDIYTDGNNHMYENNYGNKYQSTVRELEGGYVNQNKYRNKYQATAGEPSVNGPYKKHAKTEFKKMWKPKDKDGGGRIDLKNIMNDN